MANLLSRLIGGGLSGLMPKVKPTKEMGTSGTAVFGGYVSRLEKSSKWAGMQRYVTATDIAVNTSIVAAGLHHFLNLIAHPEWSVVPVDEDDKKAVEMADFVQEVIDDVKTPWARIVRRAGMYRFHGFGVQEWTAVKREDGKIGFKDIEPRPQFTIEQWEIDDTGNIVGCFQRSPQTGELLALPRGKLVYLVDDTITDSPEGLGMFRHLAEPYERLKRYYELETRGYERDLRGTPIGRAPLSKFRQDLKDGKITEAEYRAMVAHMDEFVQTQVKGSQTGLVLDSQPYESPSSDGFKIAGLPQFNLELLQGGVTGLGELDQAINRIQREMARIIGVEHLMMGDQGGNRAMSEDKSRNLYLIANSVLMNIAEAFEADLLGPLWDLNGFDEDLKPKLQTEDVAFKDAMEVAQTLSQMANAGAVMAPDDEAINDVRDLLGINRAPEPSEEMLGAVYNPKEQDMDFRQKEIDEGLALSPQQQAEQAGQGFLNPNKGKPPPGKAKKRVVGKGFSKFRKYSEDQPRHPKGVAEGGRWSGGGGASTASKPEGEGTVDDVSERAKEAVRKLPVGHQKLLADVQVFIEDTASFDGKEAMGFFHGKTNTITISRNFQGIPLEDPENTIVHELGHAIDYKTGRKLRSEIAPIMQSEINRNLTKTEYFDAMPFIQTPAEMWAELYALTYGSGTKAFGMPAEEARKKFDRSVKYMQNVMSLYKAKGGAFGGFGKPAKDPTAGKKPVADPTVRPDGYFVNSKGELIGLINGSAYPLDGSAEDIGDKVGRLKPGFYSLEGEHQSPETPAWMDAGYDEFVAKGEEPLRFSLAEARKAWDESKHPRHPAGTSQGGEFAPGFAGAASSSDVEAVLAGRQPDDRGWAFTFGNGIHDANRIRVQHGLSEITGLEPDYLGPAKIAEYYGNPNDPKAPFATDMGESLPVTNADTGELIMTLGRYGIWAYDPARDKHQVIDSGNDLLALRLKHRVHPLRFGRVKGTLAKAWDESKHPRHPKGNEDGGKFAPYGGPDLKTMIQGGMSYELEYDEHEDDPSEYPPHLRWMADFHDPNRTGSWPGRVSKFRPTQPRAPRGSAIGGQWVEVGSGAGADAQSAYHGSSTAALQSILDNGLEPADVPLNRALGADAWAHDVAEVAIPGFAEGTRPTLADLTYDWLSPSERAGRRHSVYVAKNMLSAEQFAQMAALVTNTQPVVFAVDIPKAELGHLKTDEFSHDYRFEGTIKPDWIRAYKLIDKDTPKPWLLSKEEDGVIYVVVLLPNDVIKYNPNQPRHPAGSAMGGQWRGAWAAAAPRIKEWLTKEVNTTEHAVAYGVAGVSTYLVINDIVTPAVEALIHTGLDPTVMSAVIWTGVAGLATKLHIGQDQVQYALEKTIDALIGRRMRERLAKDSGDPILEFLSFIKDILNGNIAKYRPNQLRAPKGSERGGEWVRDPMTTSGFPLTIPQGFVPPDGRHKLSPEVTTKLHSWWGSEPVQRSVRGAVGTGGISYGIHTVGELWYSTIMHALGSHEILVGALVTFAFDQIAEHTGLTPSKIKDFGKRMVASLFLLREEELVQSKLKTAAEVDPVLAFLSQLWVAIDTYPIVTKYSPNQPRHPKGHHQGGQWHDSYAGGDWGVEDGKIVAWHGTRAEVEDSILKEGIKAHGFLHDNLGIGRGSAYVTNDRQNAFDWATTYVYKHYGLTGDEAINQTVAFKLNIPKKIWERDFGGAPRHAKRDLPPEWIVGVYKPGKKEREQNLWKEETVTAYAVVVIAPIAKYSPNQPRAPKGSDRGGEWVKDHAAMVKDKLKESMSRAVNVDDSGIFAQGDGIREFDLQINKDGSLYLEWLEVDNNSKGHQAAKDALEVMYDMATETKAPRIKLEAGLESGGYVWAKMGFQAVDPQMVVTRVGYRLNQLWNTLPKELVTKVQTILNVDGPDVAYNIANLDDPVPMMALPNPKRRTKPTLGKALLLGSFYQATLPPSRYENIKKWTERDKAVAKLEGTIHIEDLLMQWMDEEDDVAKYSPDQPRRPKGSPMGGQWTGLGDYLGQALANLSTTSRTVQTDQVDTSSSGDKADHLIRSEGVADQATKNFIAAMTTAFNARNELAGKDVQGVQDFITNLAATVNEGLLKPGSLMRGFATKYPQTAPADLPVALQQFAGEYLARLKQGDPIDTAAWVEWRANLSDHFWSDGVGKTSKILAAIPLMRAGLPLPQYRSNSEFFQYAPKGVGNASAGGETYLGQEWQNFRDHYRSLMPAITKYSPDQRRAPKGRPDGGRWIDDSGLDPALDAKHGCGDATALYQRTRERGLTEQEFLKRQSPETLAAIQKAQEYLDKNQQTIDLYRMPDGTYTPERQELHKAIMASIFTPAAVAAATPQTGSKPTFVLLGGRAASGKTTALRTFGFPFDQSKFLTVSADDIQEKLPGYIPMAAGLYNQEGQDIAEQVMRIAQAAGLNIIFDATLKSTMPAVKRVDDLLALGYDVEGYFVHAAPQVSAQRILNRYLTGDRYVPVGVTLNSRTNEQTFDAIRDKLSKWALYDNNGDFNPKLVASGSFDHCVE